MTQYNNTNRGQIWGNDKKEKDTHPDFKGTINVEGKEFWLSAWKRKPDSHPKAPALSFSVQPKEGQEPQQPAQPVQPAAETAFDDIPF